MNKKRIKGENGVRGWPCGREYIIGYYLGEERVMYLFWGVCFRRPRRLMVNFLVQNTKDLGSTPAGGPEGRKSVKAKTFGPGESAIE
jgi:hypothetical protein